jgi:N-acetylglucosamine-6-sulfatase
VRVRGTALGAALLGCVLLLGACTSRTSGGVAEEEPTSSPTVEAPDAVGHPPTKRPNIVLVVMDDFSMDLLATVRSAAEMRRRGASYPYSFVVDSLCCVSRTSIFTGQYPHQTGVLINTPSSLDLDHPLGGYDAFEAYGNGERSFAVTLQQAGYTTGFVGKFLNRYEYVPGGEEPGRPPGWSDFNVLFGGAYDGWGFERSYVEDGELKMRHHPVPPAGASANDKDRTYAGTVAERAALRFIGEHRDDRRPWFLEVATYAPHSHTSTGSATARAPRTRPATAGAWTATSSVSRTCPGSATTSATTLRSTATGALHRRRGTRSP